MAHKNKNIFLPLFLFLLTILTRIPFTSKYLYHMDSVQFALALDKYDITVHQPHPPGYFLYVMLGRLIDLFMKDANTTFIFISMLFSGLTVVAIYYLGREIFDQKTGIFAALIALTSPNMWFHGEVALSYTVEAFFSTLVAFLCWQILKGEHRYIWLSAIVLGLAGGIRQNTIIFLLPLWLFSVKSVPLKKTIFSVGLLGIVCLLWFLPMIWMTGGWNAYNEAFRELWVFNTGNVSVFEKGWPLFKLFSSALFDATFYGIGAGIFVLGIAAYSLIRFKNIGGLDKTKVYFFSSWVLPSILFFLLIFIHPANPGYILIFLPALFILSAASIKLIDNDLRKVFQKDIAVALTVIIIAVNAILFFLPQHFVSYREIRTHDRNLSTMIEGIKSFNPTTTAIFVEPYTFYGYRQIMYYLPEYRVYQVDVRVLPTGEVRKTFWGTDKQTYLSHEIIIPDEIDNFVIPIFLSDMKKISMRRGLTIRELLPEFFIVSGPIRFIREVYPDLNIRVRTMRKDI